MTVSTTFYCSNIQILTRRDFDWHFFPLWYFSFCIISCHLAFDIWQISRSPGILSWNKSDPYLSIKHLTPLKQTSHSSKHISHYPFPSSAAQMGLLSFAASCPQLMQSVRNRLPTINKSKIGFIRNWYDHRYNVYKYKISANMTI